MNLRNKYAKNFQSGLQRTSELTVVKRLSYLVNIRIRKIQKNSEEGQTLARKSYVLFHEMIILFVYDVITISHAGDYFIGCLLMYRLSLLISLSSNIVLFLGEIYLF